MPPTQTFVAFFFNYHVNNIILLLYKLDFLKGRLNLESFKYYFLVIKNGVGVNDNMGVWAPTANGAFKGVVTGKLGGNLVFDIT